MWTQDHWAHGPREHNDPPGYQSREAVRLQRARPQGAFGQRLSSAQLQDSDFYVLGNPATVTRKLRQLIERLNPGYLLIDGNEGDMAPKELPREGAAYMGRKAEGTQPPGVFCEGEGADSPLSPTGGWAARRGLAVWSSPAVAGPAGNTFSPARPAG